jgi:hypothetical protein
MSTAEVMTTAMVACAFFGSNQERSRIFLLEHGYIPGMLSRGRLNRRLHAVPEATWEALFSLISEMAKQLNRDQEYIVDSLPVPVCDNYRIKRCRLYRGEKYRGYLASKRRYFYGLRVHLIVTRDGQPVELMLEPASCADMGAFKRFGFNLPQGAYLWADSAYSAYDEEAFLLEAAGVHLVPQRKRNTTQPWPGWLEYICKHTRKRVETVFSQLMQALTRRIHAATPRGFELKVFLNVLTFAVLHR